MPRASCIGRGLGLGRARSATRTSRLASVTQRSVRPAMPIPPHSRGAATLRRGARRRRQRGSAITRRPRPSNPSHAAVPRYAPLHDAPALACELSVLTDSEGMEGSSKLVRWPTDHVRHIANKDFEAAERGSYQTQEWCSAASLVELIETSDGEKKM